MFIIKFKKIIMDKLINFFIIISWIVGVLSTIGFGICTYKNITYPGSNEELFDNIKGIQKEWPGGKYLFIAIVCWAFIYSFS